MVNRVGQKLNLFETFHYHRNELKVSSCFIVASKLNVEVSKRLLIEKAKTLYFARLKLRMNVSKAQNGTLTSVEIEDWSDDYVEFLNVDESDLLEEINQLHRTTFEFNKQRPLWKFTIINNLWICILCEHTFMDGTTAALMLEDFIDLLNEKIINDDCNPDESDFLAAIVPGYYNTIMKVMETFAPKWINTCLNYFRSYSKLEDPNTPGWIFEGSKNKTFIPRKHLISLNQDEFSKIKKLIKSKNVKFTSFWEYLNLLAFSEIKANETINISVPFNVRSILPENYERAYGLFVSTIAKNLRPTYEEGFIDWDCCRFLNSSFAKHNLVEATQMIGMLQYVNHESLINSAIKAPRSTTLEISNLGVRKSSGPKYHADEFIFSQSNNQIGATVCQSIISTNDKVNIMIGGAPEFDDYFENYVKVLEKYLQKVYEYKI